MHPTPLLRPTTLLLATLAGLLTSNAPAQTTRPSLTDTDSALRFLFKQTALSRERIKSASYTVKFNTQTRLPNGTWQERPNTQTVSRDGEQIASTWQSTIHAPLTGPPPASPKDLVSPLRSNADLIPITFRVVINHNYMAYRDGDDSPFVNVYDHPSIAQRTTESRSHSQAKMLRDVLLYGCADGTSGLAHNYEVTKNSMKWTVDEATEAGHHLYQIRAFPLKPPSTAPRLFYTIDADQGFLITTSGLNMPNGDPHSKTTVSGLSIGPDQIVFPVNTLVEHYPGWNSELGRSAPPETVVQRDVISVENIKVNEPISEDVFTIKTLQVPANRIVMRVDPSNAITRWRVLDGKLVTDAEAKSLGAPPDILNEKVAAATTLATATARETIKANRSFFDKATSMPQFAFEVLAVGAIILVIHFYALRRARRKIQN